MKWRVATSGYAEVLLSSLAFDTRLASGLVPGAPKVRICTVQRFGLRQMLPNTKSMLSRAINTLARPYAAVTATMQETVRQVSSSNFSSIDEMGRFLLVPASETVQTAPFFVSSCCEWMNARETVWD